MCLLFSSEVCPGRTVLQHKFRLLRRILYKHNVWDDNGAVECVSYSVLVDALLGEKKNRPFLSSQDKLL